LHQKTVKSDTRLTRVCLPLKVRRVSLLTVFWWLTKKFAGLWEIKDDPMVTTFANIARQVAENRADGCINMTTRHRHVLVNITQTI